MLDNVSRRVREKLNQWKFQRALPCIVKTPQVKLGDTPFTLLSMVHHRDVAAYLLAVKSFVSALPPRRIVVVMDPSITTQDRDLLAAHVPAIVFLAAADCRDQALPRGGTWERLIAISNEVKHDYVVQLDADTVTLGELPEIAESIRAGRSFVLATEDEQDFCSCSAIAAWAQARLGAGEHVQVVAESLLDRVAGTESLRYVRGCSGFSGFAKDSFNRAKLIDFSQQMQHMLGNRWSEWGTEQFTSNFMVANSPQAMVLPHPKYCHPLREKPGTVFLHFVGYVRYLTPRYTQAVHQICEKLKT